MSIGGTDEEGDGFDGGVEFPMVDILDEVVG